MAFHTAAGRNRTCYFAQRWSRVRLKSPALWRTKSIFLVLVGLSHSAVLAQTPLPVPKPTIEAQERLATAGPRIENVSRSAVAENATSLDGAKAPDMRAAANPNVAFDASLLSFAPRLSLSAGLPSALREAPILVEAVASHNASPIHDGVVWRVFDPQGQGTDGHPLLVARAEGGAAAFDLPPGDYLIHASLGYATEVVRLSNRTGPIAEEILLEAGALRLSAVIDDELPIAPDEVRFDIYASNFAANGDRIVVARDLSPGETIHLNAGTYHVVSRYGTANSVVRAGLKIEAGKLVAATLYHKAAQVMLRLVNEPGGEAIANTSWSIYTPGGDIIATAEGAFPSLVLAAGEYTIVARNNDNSYSRSVDIESGASIEIEVITGDKI